MGKVESRVGYVPSRQEVERLLKDGLAAEGDLIIVTKGEFSGVSGRPATGALSVLFRLLGQARPVWSRSAGT